MTISTITSMNSPQYFSDDKVNKTNDHKSSPNSSHIRESVVYSFFSSLLPSIQKKDLSSFSISLPQNRYDVLDRVADTTSLIYPPFSYIKLGLMALPFFMKEANATQPIKIDNAQDLNRIGRNNDFPATARYVQTEDFSAPQHQPIKHFEGVYDGQFHKIEHLNNCLFSNVMGNGTVSDLSISNSNITELQHRQPIAAIACTLTDNARVNNIQITDTAVSSSQNQVPTGLIVGRMEKHSSVSNVSATHCQVSSTGNNSPTGIATGSSTDSTSLSKVTAESCQLKTWGLFSSSAIGSGRADTGVTLRDIRGISSSVTTHGHNSSPAIGSGESHGSVQIKDVHSANSTIKAEGHDTGSAICTGFSINQLPQPASISQCQSINDDISNTGIYSADASIAAGDIRGYVLVDRTISTNTTVSSKHGYASSGVGYAGNLPENYPSPIIQNTTKIGGNVHTPNAPKSLSSGFAAPGVRTTEEIDCCTADNTTYSHCQGAIQSLQLKTNATLDELCTPREYEPSTQNTHTLPTTVTETGAAASLTSGALIIASCCCIGIPAVIYTGHALYRGYKQQLRGVELAKYPCQKFYADIRKAISCLHTNSPEDVQELLVQPNSSLPTNPEVNIENEKSSHRIENSSIVNDDELLLN